ncbi:MAG: IS630 transposase-related protein, partial [Alphaproteobacteria bacterium]
MSKSYDLRVQALSYIRAGGSKAEAARLFGVTRRTLYNWLERGDELAQTVMMWSCLIGQVCGGIKVDFV